MRGGEGKGELRGRKGPKGRGMKGMRGREWREEGVDTARPDL